MAKNDYSWVGIFQNIIFWKISLPDFKLSFVSPSVKGVRGYTPEEALNQKLEEIFTSSSLEKIQKKIKEELDLNKPNGNDQQMIELEIFCKDGSIKLFRVQLSVVRDENNQAVEIVGLSQDITEERSVIEQQKRAIKELRISLAKASMLNGLLPICSGCKMIRDKEGNWHQIEGYIMEHSEASFSHGICPDCTKILYPDYAK